MLVSADAGKAFGQTNFVSAIWPIHLLASFLAPSTICHLDISHLLQSFLVGSLAVSGLHFVKASHISSLAYITKTFALGWNLSLPSSIAIIVDHYLQPKWSAGSNLACE